MSAIKYLPLGDIADFMYGFTDTAKNDGTVRFIRITDITDNGNLKCGDKKYVDLSDDNRKCLLSNGDLLMARTGATYGKTLYFQSDEPSVFASFLIKIMLDNNIMSNRFYWHFSKSIHYWEQVNKLVTKGGQPQFNANALCKIMIGIPSLEEQDYIVDILDKLEKLYFDFSNEISSEIKKLRQQYQYYQNKLFAFKEKKDR